MGGVLPSRGDFSRGSRGHVSSLGLFALQVLPVNYVGILLILLAIVLFILEVKIASFGMLAVAGIVCLNSGLHNAIRHPGIGKSSILVGCHSHCGQLFRFLSLGDDAGFKGLASQTANRVRRAKGRSGCRSHRR